MTDGKKFPSILDSLIPIIALVTMLFTSVMMYGADSSYGANQIALMLAAAIAVVIGFKNGYSWGEMEKGIVQGISTALGAILILFMVGSLIGTWIIAGTVPTMVYYGLQILEPSIFYAAACIICALVSISIGSSWTTAGTVGIALIGIASGLDMSLPITAGAIISGAYFGDKMSPLSDTTNLAPAVAGTDLFTHIRHMVWTTGPSIVIAIVIFAIIGFAHDSSNSEADLGSTLAVLSSEFTITPWALLPLFVVLFLAFKKVPAFLTLLIGSLLGGLCAVVLQSATISKSVEEYSYSCELTHRLVTSTSCSIEHKGDLQFLNVRMSLDSGNVVEDSALLSNEAHQKIRVSFESSGVDVIFNRRSQALNYIDAVWRAFFEGYTSNSGDAGVDELLSRGGMGSMMNTIWLILCAMTFGAILETIGLLQRLVNLILSRVKRTGSMIAAVLGTCIGTNIIAADQYIAIVLPGRMYRAEFKRRNLHPKNLSRVLEDSATITSPLIPWNTCGAFMAGALGVPTIAYLPFCFFNLANPIISLIYGITHFKLALLTEDESKEKVEAPGLL